MLHVVDVAASAAWYAHLGFSVQNRVHGPDGGLSWVWLQGGDAALMLARASGTVDAGMQAALLYVYVTELVALHETLGTEGLGPGEICTPFYAPRGEFRLTDPDGWTVMVMQAG
ncbi:MAG: hypothetical protein NW201_14175 [Gemmatimonadales bacterium]|nr:hypothetical protein [Gemmatimonadales bacterium]